MNKSKVGRRSFLKAGMLTGGAVVLPFSKSKSEISKPNITAAKIFIAESGVYGKDSHFIVGLLKIQGSAIIHQNNIEQIRGDLNFQTRLSYKSNNKYKLDFAKAVIDYFLGAGSLKFTAKVIPLDGMANPPNASNNQLTLDKVDIYNDVLNAAGVIVNPNALVAVKSQSPFGPSQFFKDHFQNANALGMEAIDARTSNLIQLTDLLTGNILGSITNSISNITKIEINNYLKTQLNISDLAIGTSVGGDKFIII